MEFDVDLQTNVVKCIRRGYETNNDEIDAELRNRAIYEDNTVGPIIPLGKYFPNGIE